MSTNSKQELRKRRHARVRSRMAGTATCPRVSVFKSARHIFAQAIDDSKHMTLTGFGDFNQKTKISVHAPKELSTKAGNAFMIGEKIAAELKKRKIEKAVFDRGGFKYHGRIKAVADGLRSGGIKL